MTYGPHTDRDDLVAQAIFDLIELNKATLFLDDVFYGNQNMIPRASAAVVTAMGKRRALAGVAAPGGRTDNDLMIIIDLHWSKVGDEATERKNCDDRAYALEQLIHADTTIGGIIIHGFIDSVDRGETQIANGSMFRSVRMSFTGRTKTYLSPPAAP
jgi:hypothetical protein